MSRAQKRKWETLQKKFWRQQHPVFPGGHPSKYWLGSMLLDFSDRTRTGVFNMIWPLARAQENLKIGFQQKTYLLSYICIRDSARRLGWNVVGLNLDYFYNYLSISSSLKPLFPCFEHFCAQNSSNSWEKLGEKLGFVIWAFSSLWNQICSLKAGFTARKLSFLPVINTIPTSALKVLSANYFLLVQMYLLRQYIY